MATNIRLYFSCKNLKDCDVLSKSDPCLVFYTFCNEKWVEIGRTETKSNDLNPVFSQSITIEYKFEDLQRCKLEVYDFDGDHQTMKDANILGQLEHTLGQILSCGRTFQDKLYHKDGSATTATITIYAEQVSQVDYIILLHLCGKDLDNKDTFSKSDPYLRIIKTGLGNQPITVYESEVISNSLSPDWSTIYLSSDDLCNNDYNRSFKIEVYDYDSCSKSDFIGQVETNVQECIDGKPGKTWYLINPSLAAHKKKYTHSGCIVLSSIEIEKSYSFTDYILGGLDLKFTVAIDFTTSNGHPNHPDSLHRYDPSTLNDYQAAIVSLGSVLHDYDRDNKFHAYGFGARIPPAFGFPSVFPLNFSAKDPQCLGLHGILDAYLHCLNVVEFYGPSFLAPVIRHAALLAEVSQRKEDEFGASDYHVLVLLTDGNVSDLQETLEAIVDVSYLPMSVIIIGIGNADFCAMRILDADDDRLRYRDRVAQRDIVQFVPLCDFSTGGVDKLRKQVLAEIPKQVAAYFKIRHLKPLNVSQTQ